LSFLYGNVIELLVDFELKPEPRAEVGKAFITMSKVLQQGLSEEHPIPNIGFQFILIQFVADD